jgi:predicted PurR-regulated permease PerM
MTTYKEGIRDNVLIIAGIALLLAMMRMASDIIVPFLLSLFIAIVAATPFSWLKKRGVSTLVSTIIVVAVIFILITLLAMLLGNTSTQFNEALPGYEARVNEMVSQFSSSLAEKGIKINDAGIMNALDPTAAMTFANNMIAGIGNALSYTMLIMFTVIFMLIDAAGFPRKLAAIEGEKSEATLQRLAEVVESINQYVVAKTIVSLLTGILIWISLALVGLDFAPLWGFLAFLLNFVPNIGSIIAAVPAVLMAMLQLDPAMVLVVIAVYIFINTAIGNVVEPMLLGQRVGLSTLTVFLSLVFWGWMFGAVGMLLSVPLTMVVKFAAQSSPQTQWIAVLLSPAPELVEEGSGDSRGDDSTV